MTWRELKALVEKELAKQGQTEDIEIDYMDFNGMDRPRAIVVREKYGLRPWTLTVQP